MSGDLLQTKLYVPRLRPSLIPRPHLIEKLNLGLQQGCKLTLISAPAGFGKTTFTFLLDHLPPQMHLAIVTRSDPNFPLARLRGRGQINELRAADLRFTVAESAAFIQQIIGVDISPEQIAVLNKRTEGWIAGLQMTAVSMRGMDDIPGFIATFAGDHRYIVDYLVDEVLAQCSQDTRDFLLQTSILERMSPSLCDILSGQSGSQTILAKLERENLFTLPLDQRREWYRYHHLFAELLRHRLRQTYPERIERLYARASRWLDDNGFTYQAIKHALAMDDKTLAADLIERHAKTLLYQSQIQTMLKWFKALPEDLIRERPLLCIFHAWALIFDNPNKNYGQVEQKLAYAQQTLATIDSDGTLEKIVAGHAVSIRALLSQPPVQTDHDPHAVLGFLHEAQFLLPPSETEIRSINNVNIGYEYLHLGDTKAALKANKSAFAEAQAGNNHLVAAVSICSQALIAYFLGELARAVEICQQGIVLFDQQRSEKRQSFPILGTLFITLGYMLTERGELEKAEIELTKGIDLLQWVGEYEILSLGHIALIRLLLLKGDDDNALQIIERFERQWPACAALAETLRIQVLLSRCESDHTAVEHVRLWMQENQLEFKVDSDFPGITPWAETRHLAHLTWIQAQIAFLRLEPGSPQKTDLHACLDYLKRRLQVAQQRKLAFRIIECSVLKSLALDAMGNRKKAADTLAQAFSLAEPEGFRRVFLDKGRPMARLLRNAAKNSSSSEFVRQLLSAFEKPTDVKTEQSLQNLVEPISERELEVLQLIAEGLTNREISQRLFLAMDTVKGHNRKIYGKLGVKNRTQAVKKATSLKILPPQ